MSAMVTEIYDALRSVGVEEDKAKAAASAMFTHDLATRDAVVDLDKHLDKRLIEVDKRLVELDKRIIVVEKELQFMKWGVCVIIAFLVVESIARFVS